MTRRKLNLKARAARMEETRQRIVRAAFDLHRTVGPARTTISAIAEQAGVQRHTVYHHFPDELTLGAACTEYGLAHDPQPDPTAFVGIALPEDRLREALVQQYAYYRRNEALLANLERDAPLLQQKLAEYGVDWESMPEVMRAFFEQPHRLRLVLLQGWQPQDSDNPLLPAAIGLAIDFRTWQTLVRQHGLTDSQAIKLMLSTINAAATRHG